MQKNEFSVVTKTRKRIPKSGKVKEKTCRKVKINENLYFYATKSFRANIFTLFCK